jgi:hypothetical protein
LSESLRAPNPILGVRPNVRSVKVFNLQWV